MIGQLLKQKRVGVLLHISSLPVNNIYTTEECGDMGAMAWKFVDFLHTTGTSIWQTLPLNMPHGDKSPYQCLSAHAGNADFIALQPLIEQAWLSQTELDAALSKTELLAQAYWAFEKSASAEIKKPFIDFCEQQAFWLDDFALYLLLRKKFNQQCWNTWPVEYKNRHPQALESLVNEQQAEIAEIKFAQFLFFQQWDELKQYARSKQVYMFGDIPIFVAYDSADVWSNPALFKLDEQHNMTVVAGVPPDYFSVTGQRWGNPHYNWPLMEADGFQWWLARIKTQYKLFDLVRIDHFRGLESAWEIPATEETAMNGEWVAAPGDALLKAITEAFPSILLVAEDLGIITDEVNALRNTYHLPGMKILQFAFGGEDSNPYLPHNIEVKSVVYTGTHDNDTTLGWFNTLDDHQKNHLQAYIDQDSPDMPFALIELALASNAELAIIPMQDILELDTSARMNVPGTSTDNWAWKFSWNQLSDTQIKKFTELIRKHGRLN